MIEYIPAIWQTFAYDEVWVYETYYNSLTYYQVGFSSYLCMLCMGLLALVFNIWNDFMDGIHKGSKNT